MPIEMRHRTYFAYLDIPKDVRATLARRVYRQTLQTASRTVAERRAAPIIARWKSDIATARDEPDSNDAKFWRDALRRTKTPEERQEVLSQIDAAAWDMGAVNVPTIGDAPSSDPQARRFHAEATGTLTPTTEHLEEWIASQQAKEKTAGMRRAAVKLLAGKFPMLKDVTRPEVRRWVTELLAELKPATVQRMLSDCRTYWTYLATINAVPEDSGSFDKLGLKVKRASWLPYTPEEAVRLLRGAEADHAPLDDLVRLAMYSGARREELCSLRIEHVKADCFEIVDAKTAAGIRTVPSIPSCDRPLRDWLRRARTGSSYRD